MSKQTLNALDDAIRDHIADEARTHTDSTDLVTHWVLVAGVAATDGDGFWIEAPEGQPRYVGIGLLHSAMYDSTDTGEEE